MSKASPGMEMSRRCTVEVNEDVREFPDLGVRVTIRHVRETVAARSGRSKVNKFDSIRAEAMNSKRWRNVLISDLDPRHTHEDFAQFYHDRIIKPETSP